jgi:hypothetical protein
MGVDRTGMKGQRSVQSHIGRLHSYNADRSLLPVTLLPNPLTSTEWVVNKYERPWQLYLYLPPKFIPLTGPLMIPAWNPEF